MRVCYTAAQLHHRQVTLCACHGAGLDRQLRLHATPFQAPYRASNGSCDSVSQGAHCRYWNDVCLSGRPAVRSFRGQDQITVEVIFGMAQPARLECALDYLMITPDGERIWPLRGVPVDI
jgi:hypothetical protein